MKELIIQILTVLICLSSRAQKVSNIRAEQRGQEIIVFYSLETTSPCEVSLLLSQDNGATWGSINCNEDALKVAYELFVQNGYRHSIEDFRNLISSNTEALKDSYILFVNDGYAKDYNQYKILLGLVGQQLQNVSGDVGKNVSAGEKQITWKVLEEQEHLLGDNIKFKVIASGTETFEPEMIFVEGGTFQMGNNLGDSDEKPIHSVTLKNYYIGKYEITRAQWVAIMGYKPNFGRVCDNCPVDAVSWNDIHKYVLKLNSITGKGYRLPTEAEWEYAARGGRQDKGNSYMSSSGLSSSAWFNENSSGITHEVGSRLANELGIYDMLGNVSEWCSDWYGNYKNIEVSNPKGPVKGTYRVLRGGSWSDSERNCRETDRYWMNSDDRYVFCGFRLVLPVE